MPNHLKPNGLRLTILPDIRLLEECGLRDDLKTRLMTVVAVELGACRVDCHLELIAVKVKKSKQGYRDLVALDPELQEEVNTYFKLNGDEMPKLIEHGKYKYLVLMYPFAE